MFFPQQRAATCEAKVCVLAAKQTGCASSALALLSTDIKPPRTTPKSSRQNTQAKQTLEQTKRLVLCENIRPMPRLGWGLDGFGGQGMCERAPLERQGFDKNQGAKRKGSV